jgi:hypothetical protein
VNVSFHPSLTCTILPVTSSFFPRLAFILQRTEQELINVKSVQNWMFFSNIQQYTFHLYLKLQNEKPKCSPMWGHKFVFGERTNKLFENTFSITVI